MVDCNLGVEGSSDQGPGGWILSLSEFMDGDAALAFGGDGGKFLVRMEESVLLQVVCTGPLTCVQHTLNSTKNCAVYLKST